jgi:hypothetical protein
VFWVIFVVGIIAVIADIVRCDFGRVFVSMVKTDRYNPKIRRFSVNIYYTRVSAVIMGYQLVGACPTTVLTPNPDFILEW